MIFKKRVISKAIQKILSKPEVIPILQGRESQKMT